MKLPASASVDAPEGITQLLLKWSDGDRAAREKLMPLVYDELHRLAAKYLRRERANHTLQPTALVNEAYLRLVDQHRVQWQKPRAVFRPGGKTDAQHPGRSRAQSSSRGGQ